MPRKSTPTKKRPGLASARKRAAAAPGKAPAAPRAAAKKKGGTPRRWSQRVTETSDALDLKAGVFEQKSPRAVAASLKRSAESSRRRKGSAYQSAMSMLTFFMNRAGKQLGGARRRVLESAKRELRALFHRPAEA